MFEMFNSDLESGRVCPGLEMAVELKRTDCEPNLNHVSCFSMIFLIVIALASFPS